MFIQNHQNTLDKSKHLCPRKKTQMKIINLKQIEVIFIVIHLQEMSSFNVRNSMLFLWSKKKEKLYKKI